LQKGFSRLYDGEVLRIEDLLENEKWKPAAKKKTWLLIDRLVVKDFDEEDIHRIGDSVGTAFYEGEGSMNIEINGDKLLPFSNKFELDGIVFEEPVPNLFSFNNPYGACPTCEGFSQVLGIDADLVIP
jgi:excinuclease ABC subunit A